MNNRNDLFVKMVLDQWFVHVKRAHEVFSELSDDQLMKETSPGRNRGIYLLGHLTCVHDKMNEFLDFGPIMHPELFPAFYSTPDRSVADLPSIADLRKAWNEINTFLEGKMNALTAEQWFERHTAVSAENFTNEPHRNKLNLVINRTNHLASHSGQLLYLRRQKAS